MRSLLLVPSGDADAFAAGWASGADALVADAADMPPAPSQGGPALYLWAPEQERAANGWNLHSERIEAIQRPLERQTFDHGRAGWPRLARNDDEHRPSRAALDDVAKAAWGRGAGAALRASAGGADVQRLGARLALAEARLGLPEGVLKILAFATETPQAVLGLPSYGGASERLVGLVATTAPLSAALHAAPSGAPLRYARELAVIGARAAGVVAIAPPHPGHDGLAAAARAARDDGFDGMVALDPAQIATINATFGR